MWEQIVLSTQHNYPGYLRAWLSYVFDQQAFVCYWRYEWNCLPFEVFAATVVPLVVGADVGEDNFVVIWVGRVCVSDLGDIIFVVIRVVVDPVV